MIAAAGPVKAEQKGIVVDEAACKDYSKSSHLEWLETNGLGSFASGTVSGANTRRYHGLLVASLHPPVDRFVMLSKQGGSGSSFTACRNCESTAQNMMRFRCKDFVDAQEPDCQ